MMWVCIMHSWCVLCSIDDRVLATCAEYVCVRPPNSQLPPHEITVIREIMGDTGVQEVVRSAGWVLWVCIMHSWCVYVCDGCLSCLTVAWKMQCGVCEPCTHWCVISADLPASQPYLRRRICRGMEGVQGMCVHAWVVCIMLWRVFVLPVGVSEGAFLRV